MEQPNKIVSDDTTESGAESSEEKSAQTPTIEDLMAEIQAIKGNRDDLLGEKKRKVAENQELKQKYDALIKEKKQAELKKLEEEKNYKQLLELERQRAQELEQKFNGLNDTVVRSQKLQTFLGALPGTVDQAYWSLIDIDELAIDPESGQPDQLSLQKLVEDFTSKHSILIKKPNAPKTPNDAPSGTGSGTITYQQWLNLPSKEQAARMKDVDRSTM